MAKKKFKQICTCENCGNEAEMIVTCEWVEVEEETKTKNLSAAVSHASTTFEEKFGTKNKVVDQEFYLISPNNYFNFDLSNEYNPDNFSCFENFRRTS